VIIKKTKYSSQNLKSLFLSMKGLKGFLAIFFFTPLLSIKGLSQTTLFIRLTDSSTHKNIVNATIVAKSNDDVLAFCFTDEFGECKLELEHSVISENVFIQITLIGYVSKTIALKKLKTASFVNLIELVADVKTEPLKPVVVKTRTQKLLRVNGDTLSYAVKQLANAADRSIEDVVKRIPGIEILPNGQIQYYGKPIAGFTIDHDDVMGQRYALATQNVKPEMVDSIQILQRTQKTKALIGVVGSENNYLNIVLNTNATVKPIITAELGLGNSSFYELNNSLLLFKKSFKTVGTSTFNNTRGSSLEPFKEFKIGGNNSDNELLQTSELLSFSTIAQPSIDKDSWLNNNSIGIDLHSFKRFTADKHVQLAANVISDKNDYSYNGIVSFFFPIDTIRYTESGFQENSYKRYLLSFLYEENKRNRYTLFKVNTSVNRSSTNGNIADIQQNFRQYGTKPSIHHTINFSSILPLHQNKLLNFNVNASFGNLKESGANFFTFPILLYKQFDSILYFQQHIQQQPIKAKATAGIQLLNFFNTAFKFGLSHYSNSIQIVQNSLKQNGILGIDTFFSGINKTRTTSFFSSVELSRVTKNVDMNAEISYNYFPIHIYTNEKNGNRYNTNLLNYKFFIKHQFRKESKLMFSHSLFSYVNNTDDGLLFPLNTNYRTVVVYSSLFPQSRLFSTSLNYNYLKSLKLLSLNVGVMYQQQQNQAILSSVITENISVQELINFKHFFNTIQFNASLSKYLFKLKTNVMINYSNDISRLPQVQNNTVVKWKNNLHDIRLVLRKKIIEFLQFEATYSSKIGTISSKTDVGTMSSFNFFENATDINILFGIPNFSSKVSCQLTNSYFNNRKVFNNALFQADCKYQFNKSKMQLYGKFFNVFNSTFFSEQNNTSFSQTIAGYALRKPIFLFGISFVL